MCLILRSKTRLRFENIPESSANYNSLRRRTRLHQAWPTRHHVSGGEARTGEVGERVAKTIERQTFYILNEPTTGLHFEDVRQFARRLAATRGFGNTVLVIKSITSTLSSAPIILSTSVLRAVSAGVIISPRERRRGRLRRGESYRQVREAYARGGENPPIE